MSNETTASINTAPLNLNASAHATLLQVIPFLYKAEDREVLTKAAIQDGHLYAADGHSLIRIPVKPLLLGKAKPKDGAYDLIKAGKEVILRPCAEDLQPPTFKFVVDSALKEHPDRFAFEWKNDNRPSSLINRSDLSFSLASWGICLDFEKVKTIPLETTWSVSGIRNNSGALSFKSIGQAHEALILIMPRRTDKLPRYTGLTKEEGLAVDSANFIREIHFAQFQKTDKTRLAEFTRLAPASKDLVRRAAGRA